MGFPGLWRTIGVAVFAAASSTQRAASAVTSELSDAEIVALESGRPVVREENVERNGRRYIGGVSYIVIDATPGQVVATLDDVRSYRYILPNTRSVRWIGLSRKGDAVVELEQGNAVAHGKYTVRVHRDLSAGDSSAATIRFSLDSRYAHDLADARGFFHVEARGEKTLLTYLVTLDLGQGILGRLFEGKVRRAALSAPGLVKRYVESHHAP